MRNTGGRHGNGGSGLASSHKHPSTRYPKMGNGVETLLPVGPAHALGPHPTCYVPPKARTAGPTGPTLPIRFPTRSKLGWLQLK